MMNKLQGWDVLLGKETFHPDLASATTHALAVRYHMAWLRRDIDALLALIDGSVEYNDFFQGRRISSTELREYLLASMPASGDEEQTYTDRLRVDGDTAFLQYQVTLRGTQGLVSFQACEALTMRNGMVVRVNEYATLVRRHDVATCPKRSRMAVSHLGLSARQLSQLASDIQQYFQQHQPYLKSDLDMSQVSTATGYTRNQISFFLNQILGRTFYQHINKLRMRHLLAQLKGGDDVQPIEEIARAAGFRSLSTFYSCFREETGLSPKAYLARLNADI